MSEETSQVDAADLDVWAFSESGPWCLTPSEIRWSTGLQTLREDVQAEVPKLIRKRFAPPLGRVLRVGIRVGSSLLAWKLRESGSQTALAALSRRLREAFEDLGPAYIKAGQIVSSGRGIYPDELVEEFRRCRDQVPAAPFDVVKQIVEEELGRPLEQVFSSFDRDCVASASIAQVHAATLISGEEVVVKVQRLGVYEQVRLDIAAMAWMARRLIGRIPVATLANPLVLVEVFAETILEELDFRLEAENMLDVARGIHDAGQTMIIVPRPHPEFVTRRMLVMERMHGYAYDDIEEIKRAGIDTEKVVRSMMTSFLEGAMIYGVFHGDLHGGNLFIMDDGRVALMDFGITGRLNEKQRNAFLRALMSGSVNDIKGQLEAFRDLGAFDEDIDIDELIEILRIEERIRAPRDLSKLSTDQLLSDVRGTVKDLMGMGAKLPKSLMLYIKNMIFFDSAMAELAPDMNMLHALAGIYRHFAAHHGETIATLIGFDASRSDRELSSAQVVLAARGDEVGPTHRQLRDERKEMMKKMAARRHPKPT